MFIATVPVADNELPSLTTMSKLSSNSASVAPVTESLSTVSSNSYEKVKVPAVGSVSVNPAKVTMPKPTSTDAPTNSDKSVKNSSPRSNTPGPIWIKSMSVNPFGSVMVKEPVAVRVPASGLEPSGNPDSNTLALVTASVDSTAKLVTVPPVPPSGLVPPDNVLTVEKLVVGLTVTPGAPSIVPTPAPAPSAPPAAGPAAVAPAMAVGSAPAAINA